MEGLIEQKKKYNRCYRGGSGDHRPDYEILPAVSFGVKNQTGFWQHQDIGIVTKSVKTQGSGNIGTSGSSQNL